MLWMHGEISLGDVALRAHVAIERDFRVFAIERRGVAWDTRCEPPRGVASGWASVYAVLDGTLRWFSPVDLLVRAPGLFIVDEALLEGGQNPLALRSVGEPSRIVDLRVPTRWMTREAPTPRAVELSESLLAALRAYWQAAHASQGAGLVAAARNVLDELFLQGITRESLADRIVVDEGDVARTWCALMPFFHRLEAMPTQAELADVAGVSSRQLARDIQEIVARYDLAERGAWRTMSGALRLRLAILLCTGRGVRIRDVARAVGYTSAEAMTRALRAAGVPAPRTIRERYGV